MALGPIARVLAQAAVMGIGIMARAIPAAYGAALNNARKGGVDAAKANSEGIFGKKKIAVDEAMLVLNLVKGDVNPKAVQKQFDRYFAANAVEKGGSFYLQSKIYRAKEQLDEFIRETEEMKKQEASGSSSKDTDGSKDSSSSS
eukprot:18418_1